MKSASASRVAAQFNDFLDASEEEPVLVTRNGKPVAVLMSVRTKAEAERLAASPPHSLRAIFQQASKQIEQGEGIPHERFWEQVAQSRAARRKRHQGRRP
jgi:prevent-host-death family protein